MSTAVAAFTLFVRASVSDYGLHFDKSWTSCILLTFFNRCCDCAQVVTVFHQQGLPAISIETLSDILGEAQVKLTVERDIVGVIQEDQFAQLQVTCQ
ncbi:hypothetical protein D3C81_988110 [compost metagenome]